jgi:hypothetical protein
MSGSPIARNSSRVHRSEKSDPNPVATIRHAKAIRAEVRIRWSHEVSAGRKLIPGEWKHSLAIIQAFHFDNHCTGLLKATDGARAFLNG